jgi:hypothetical protein
MPKSTKKVSLSIALAITIALLFVVQPRPLMAQATTVTTNVQMPVNQTLTDCNGQPVVLSGTVHLVAHFTTDANGGTHAVIHTNYQGVSGTSPSNPGVTYQAVNSSHLTFNSNEPQNEFTSVENVRLVSSGSTNNLIVKFTTHTTINANGQATSSFTHIDVVCNG